MDLDTTDFSRVVLHFHSYEQAEIHSWTRPASAACRVNFADSPNQTSAAKLKYHAAKAGGVQVR